MFDLNCKENIGKEYKDFVLLNVEDINDYNAKAVYFRHKTTGLEVYHIINDDRENLFSFGFRTLPNNSTGVAHIMEHSVLCGSEKFPLKEPFNTLDNQSVKTFLNAMTYPEKTLYPAASIIKSDYFNLMDVYADAVFFPKISRQTFMQEGHRFELNEKGEMSIQGVVFNEMKGSYSDFMQVAFDEILKSMFSDSIFKYDSGGDPICIPSLQYEDFLAFHKEFYCPSNCLLFLYGNISTKEQLDFISEKYISRLEKKYGLFSCENINSSLPFMNNKIRELHKINKSDKSFCIKAIAPDNGATGSVVDLVWYSGESDSEKNYLAEVISGNDSSPLSVKLQNSELGQGMNPFCGHFAVYLDESIFSFGLQGVKKGDEEKVKELILKSIQEIYDEGISDKDIDSAIMGIDFSLRETNRSYGPFSLVLMNKVTKAWGQGKKPSYFLNSISEFNIVKEKIKKDKDYTRSLIKKYFLDNNIFGTIFVEPSKKYFAQRQKIEKEIIKKSEKTINKVELKEELKSLHEYQQKVETEAELSCIPHLSINELNQKREQIDTEYEVLNRNGINIPCIFNKFDTRGIVYVDVCFPIDNLSPEYFLDIPLFTAILTNMGWNGKNWADCTQEMACIMGDTWVKLELSSIPESENQKKHEVNEKNIYHRMWMNISCKFLREKTEESLKLFGQIISTMDFSDETHFNNLLDEYITYKKNSFIDNGGKYSILRTKRNKSKYTVINELLYGITQFYHLDSYSKEKTSDLLKQFSTMYTSIKDQGAIIHVAADEKSTFDVKKYLSDFIEEASLKELKEKINYTKDDYQKFIYSNSNSEEEVSKEICKIDSQVGYASLCFDCSDWLSKDSIAEDLVCSWISGHQLWEKIRMTGGAYGGNAYVDVYEALCILASWHDPTPNISLDLFIESLKEFSMKELTSEELEKTIISCYSDLIIPLDPTEKGKVGLKRFLNLITPDLLEKKRQDLLSLTVNDVKEAAIRLYKNAIIRRSEMIICDKNYSCTGNNIEINI